MRTFDTATIDPTNRFVLVAVIGILASCATVEPLPVCGDGVCEWSGDEPGICPEDCTVCGDNACGENETGSCEIDCTECGDGVCEDIEVDVCVLDCHMCSSEATGAYLVSCDDLGYCPEEWPCEACGDGVCHWMEVDWCPDCGYETDCGDGWCDVLEFGACPEDCAVCGDHICSDGETGCPHECAVCGDGVCEVTDSYNEAVHCNVDCRS